MEVNEKVSVAGFELLAKIVHGVLEKCGELDSIHQDPQHIQFDSGVQHAIVEIGQVVFGFLSSANSEISN